MPRRNARRLMGLFGLVLFMALVVPAIFGEAPTLTDQSGGDPWRNWVSEFQTLITGILAVSAATWTVFTMDRTDAASEKRHRELVGLSLRKEALQVDQLVNPDFDLLVVIREACEHFVGLPLTVTKDVGALKALNDEVSYLEKHAADLPKIMARPTWRDASPLFDGALYKRRDDVVSTCGEVSKGLAVAAHKNLSLRRSIETNLTTAVDREDMISVIDAIQRGMNIEKDIEVLEQVTEALREDVFALRQALSDVVDGLGRLRARYQNVPI
ncbi:hypothetical protein [Agrobacterium tumefaciens]|uniref:hypothetical protein n=1 Tax=Agrobacterium tumefaciens TaxID=358 RepID=UPI001267D906